MTKRLSFLFVLMILLSSCNLPASHPAAQSGLALTITAQALLIQGAQTQAGQTATPTATAITAAPANTVAPAAPASGSPTSTVAANQTPTLTLTPAPSQTGTLGVVMVSVTVDTNCRSGPGPVYPAIGNLLVGQSAVVTAKNTPSNYWIIKNAQNPGTTCWLWGQYAVISGDPSKLPEAAIPPTPTPTVTPTFTPSPTPAIPAAPSNLTQTSSCILNPNSLNNVKYITTISLRWTDKSGNEDGFRIYIGNTAANISGGGSAQDYLLGTLGPDVTSVQFKLDDTGSSKFLAKVEAFNKAGASQRIAVFVNPSCPN